MTFALDPSMAPCSLHKGHTPKIWRTVSHHVIPQAWTSQLGQPDSARVTICDTAHYAIHLLIDALVFSGAVPSMPRAYRDLALEAEGWWIEHSKPPVHRTAEAPRA